MPKPLTVAQLEAIRSQIGSNPSVAYAQLASMGYGYANLANGVVTCANVSGAVAQGYLDSAAKLQGVNLSLAQTSQMKVDLANAYITALESETSNGSNRDITYNEGLSFHTSMFATYHLNIATTVLI